MTDDLNNLKLFWRSNKFCEAPMKPRQVPKSKCAATAGKRSRLCIKYHCITFMYIKQHKKTYDTITCWTWIFFMRFCCTLRSWTENVIAHKMKKRGEETWMINVRRCGGFVFAVLLIHILKWFLHLSEFDVIIEIWRNLRETLVEMFSSEDKR